MPDGSILSGEKESLWDMVKAWYESNPNVEEMPSLIYPVDIFWLADEVTKTIRNTTEIEIAKKYCDKEEEEKGCFKLVYPVSWIMPGGLTVTMEHEEDWSAIKAWYESNPDTEEKPNLVYPVEIVFDNVAIQIINNSDEMEVAKVECE